MLSGAVVLLLSFGLSPDFMFIALYKYSFLQKKLFCYRADAPIIGYLLEYCSVKEFAIGFDEDGHCFGATNADLPSPKCLSWELNEKVCV